MKICTKCKVEKDLDCFYKGKGEHGLMYMCKSCSKTTRNNYIKNNPNKKREYIKRYKEKNPEKIKSTYSNRSEHYKKYAKEYYEKNKDKIREAKKKHIKKYNAKRRKTDGIYRLKSNLRSRIYAAIKKGGNVKNSNTFDILGADINMVRAYLERQFKNGMTWNNLGRSGWQIDHKIPISSAKTESDVLLLCHYTNLQPLWEFENISKSNKILPFQVILPL